MSVAFLLVTCCLEQSRSDVLDQVIANLLVEAPEVCKLMTVFDNASTVPGTQEKLRQSFEHVKLASKNVGYWSAIDWWLDSLASEPPKYTYIIESDMIHYGFDRLWSCATFLDTHPDVGSVRLHEYQVDKAHLYNKDAPVRDSRRTIWQSHTNKVTGKPITTQHADGDVWVSNFLTQLPALNRYESLRKAIDSVKAMPRFSELDFQRAYWQLHQRTGILNGGLFHCDPGAHGVKAITGSWTSEAQLVQLGYQTTRFASITPQDQYTVTALK